MNSSVFIIMGPSYLKSMEWDIFDTTCARGTAKRVFEPQNNRRISAFEPKKTFQKETS
jgi:hypothetical protein